MLLAALQWIHHRQVSIAFGPTISYCRYLIERNCMSPAASMEHGHLQEKLADNFCVVGAVPMTVFTLDYCIRYPACTVTEIAVKELKSVDSFSDSATRTSADFISRFTGTDVASVDPDILRKGPA